MARIKLSGSIKCIKYATYAFTILFFIFGIVVFAVGVRVRSTLSFVNLSDNHTGAYLLIFIGIVMVVTGFIGFWGAYRENQCMLVLYFGTLFIIFVFLMSAGLWAAAYRGKLDTKMTKFLYEKVTNYNKPETSKEEIAYMDDLQKKLSCCGVDSSQDYEPIGAPSSCGEGPREKALKKGCLDKLKLYFEDNLGRIVGVGIAIGIIMLLGMTFAIAFCCAVREAEKLVSR